jgi:hypothetical protein
MISISITLIPFNIPNTLQSNKHPRADSIFGQEVLAQSNIQCLSKQGCPQFMAMFIWEKHEISISWLVFPDVLIVFKPR